MEAIKQDRAKWLGEAGIILGDSGASDGNGVFMNPYHAASEPKHLHFNFSHSSTRLPYPLVSIIDSTQHNGTVP